MNKRPTTWKDFISMSNQEKEIQTSDGHHWKVIKKIGGQATPIRTYSSYGQSKITGIERQETVIIYECQNCRIQAQRKEKDSLLSIPHQYRGMTCSDVLVRDIIT